MKDITYIVVFVTAGNREEAQRIADGLIEGKLAACVNIVDGVDSVFVWQGKRDSARETLLIIKSRMERFSALVEAVKAVHTYEVPEIIALPIVDGHKPYLTWIDESIGKS